VAPLTRQPFPCDQLQDRNLFFVQNTITLNKFCRVTIQLDNTLTFRTENIDQGRL